MKFCIRRWLLVIMVFVFVNGCATMRSSWEETKSVNDIQAYEKFLSDYPEGELAEQARAKIEQLRFEGVKREDTIDTYEKFLSDYPESRFFQEVKNKLDNKIAVFRNLNTKKIKIEQEQEGDIDLLLKYTIKEILEEMGLEIAAPNSSDFDATLKIGPIKTVTWGIVTFSPSFSSDSKQVTSLTLSESTPYAYSVKISLYHQQDGEVFEKEIAGDRVNPGTEITQKQREESFLKIVKAKIQEDFKKYLGRITY